MIDLGILRQAAFNPRQNNLSLIGDKMQTVVPLPIEYFSADKMKVEIGYKEDVFDEKKKKPVSVKKKVVYKLKKEKDELENHAAALNAAGILKNEIIDLFSGK